MAKLNVGIVGGSGYVGGEAARLLLSHPNANLNQVTSESNAGNLITNLHPNLRKRTELRFSKVEELKKCDLLFLCLPHGEAMNRIDHFKTIAEKIIDLSADFRLNSASEYQKWYGIKHSRPGLLNEFVYGIPELHREKMKKSNFISSAGCNATAVTLALFPLYIESLVDTDRTVAEVKTGSSEAGATFSAASHHPERRGAVRSYSPTGHRHTAEILQELSSSKPNRFHLSATSIEMVRGVLATCHVFLNDGVDLKTVWKAYRAHYSQEPFIRFVAETKGIYRFPEPKLLIGTNYCDIGFELDNNSNRLVVISAIDNLMKGAAGQAVQAFNIMNGFDETTGLEFPGLHPI